MDLADCKTEFSIESKGLFRFVRTRKLLFNDRESRKLAFEHWAVVETVRVAFAPLTNPISYLPKHKLVRPMSRNSDP